MEDLRGAQPTPSLVGVAFAFKWKDDKLRDYFDGLRATMPQDAPDSLSDAAYVDLVAYLLAENGFPPGDSELRLGLLDSVVIAATF